MQLKQFAYTRRCTPKNRPIKAIVCLMKECLGRKNQMIGVSINFRKMMQNLFSLMLVHHSYQPSMKHQPPPPSATPPSTTLPSTTPHTSVPTSSEESTSYRYFIIIIKLCKPYTLQVLLKPVKRDIADEIFSSLLRRQFC